MTTDNTPVTAENKPAAPANPLRVLVIDDEAQIRKFLRIGLGHVGYKVDEAETAGSGVRFANSLKPDVILLDLGLPDMDGQEALKKLREAGHQQPILILSVRNDPNDIITALDNGADDYLTKPFGMDELLARMRSITRRAILQRTDGVSELSAGPLHINLLRREVTLGGNLLELSPKEFKLLHELALHANKVLTHKHLLVHVWGPAHVEDHQYLRVYMGQLRKKLTPEGAAEPSYLKTLQGIGYMLDTSDSPAASS
jgi:two-component system, OmpR family, KDP operon response regulator KdpE